MIAIWVQECGYWAQKWNRWTHSDSMIVACDQWLQMDLRSMIALCWAQLVDRLLQWMHSLIVTFWDQWTQGNAHNFCGQIAIIVRSTCAQCAITMQSECNQTAITLHSHCDHFGTLNFPSTVFRNGQLVHGADRRIFEEMTSAYRSNVPLLE